MNSWWSSNKAGTYILFLLLLFSVLMLPSQTPGVNTQIAQDNWTSLNINAKPQGLVAKIKWPLISHPAIMLNGSIFEVHIQGPSNLTALGWSFSLYREYRSYSLTYDTPLWNSTTSEWHINVTIPTSAERDLYDLQIGLTDGVNSLELIEWNAVQVRYEYPANLTLFHITDTHLILSAPEPAKIFLYSLYQAAMANADLIVITGDLTEDGMSSTLNSFIHILRQSRVPTFICPGNHDKDETGENNYNTYSSFFGPDYYTAKFGPDVFLVLANSGASGILNFTQIGWIERDMAASTAQLKILGFHHPLYYVDSDYFYLDEDEAIELIRICDTYDVDLVLTGHLHNDRVDRVNDTLWILTAPCGGGPWTEPTDPGHHQCGFRVIEFENYVPVKWNWTVSECWSQPWNKVQLARYPADLHEVDVGGMMTITNTLDEPLSGQVVDFLVRPVSGGNFYHAIGAPVVETINGTDAWLVRFSVDLDVDESKTLRLYPSNAQPPTLAGLEYPDSFIPGEVYYIYANWTNPISGILRTRIDVSINDEPYSSYGMSKFSDGRYMYVLFREEAASIRFRVSATDYSGQTTTSDVYSIPLATNGIPPPIPIWIILAGASVVVVIVVVVAIVYLYRRRSLS
ncbi:MAG: metallophosphoesterase family protein [Promethearchaeota archaeon]